mmetsp:Transcript_52980/g.124372  ORF Transcript_52980/g.124372 Transcript_52980/m.124372 type:complete len:243 (-) Transcript_52980:493-1221(-)
MHDVCQTTHGGITLRRVVQILVEARDGWLHERVSAGAEKREAHVTVLCPGGEALGHGLHMHAVASLLAWALWQLAELERFGLVHEPVLQDQAVVVVREIPVLHLVMPEEDHSPCSQEQPHRQAHLGALGPQLEDALAFHLVEGTESARKNPGHELLRHSPIPFVHGARLAHQGDTLGSVRDPEDASRLAVRALGAEGLRAVGQQVDHSGDVLVKLLERREVRRQVFLADDRLLLLFLFRLGL